MMLVGVGNVGPVCPIEYQHSSYQNIPTIRNFDTIHSEKLINSMKIVEEEVWWWSEQSNFLQHLGIQHEAEERCEQSMDAMR